MMKVERSGLPLSNVRVSPAQSVALKVT